MMQQDNTINQQEHESPQQQNINPLMEPYSTLDEPVRDTIMRDVRAVMRKLRVVLLPLDRDVSISHVCVSIIDYSIHIIDIYDTAYHQVSYMNIGSGVSASETDAENTTSGGEASENDNMIGQNQREVINNLKDWDLWGPLFLCLALSVLLSFEATPSQASTVFASIFVIVWVGAAIVTVNAQLLGGTISFFQSVCVLGYCIFPMVISAFFIALFRRTALGIFWLDLAFVLLAFGESTS